MKSFLATLWPYLFVSFLVFCLICFIKVTFDISWAAALGAFGVFIGILVVREARSKDAEEDDEEFEDDGEET
jgi:hypothetical protein